MVCHQAHLVDERQHEMALVLGSKRRGKRPPIDRVQVDEELDEPRDQLALTRVRSLVHRRAEALAVDAVHDDERATERRRVELEAMNVRHRVANTLDEAHDGELVIGLVPRLGPDVEPQHEALRGRSVAKVEREDLAFPSRRRAAGSRRCSARCPGSAPS